MRLSAKQILFTCHIVHASHIFRVTGLGCLGGFQAEERTFSLQYSVCICELVHRLLKIAKEFGFVSI